jgi:hypothetical protein
VMKSPLKNWSGSVVVNRSLLDSWL